MEVKDSSSNQSLSADEHSKDAQAKLLAARKRLINGQGAFTESGRFALVSVAQAIDALNNAPKVVEKIFIDAARDNAYAISCPETKKINSELKISDVVETFHRKGVKSAKHIKLRAEDGEPVSAIFAKQVGDKSTNKTKIYFHGRSGNIQSLRNEAIEDYKKKGFNVLVFGYRGSDGEPEKQSQESLVKDAKAVFDFLRKKEDLSFKDFHISAHSLGSAVFLGANKHLVKDLRMKVKYGDVRLHVPFASIREMAVHYTTSGDELPKVFQGLYGKYREYFVNNSPRLFGWLPKDIKALERMRLPKSLANFIIHRLKLLPDIWNNLDAIKYLDAENVMVIHGTKDQITPYEQGYKVYQTLKKKGKAKKGCFIRLDELDHYKANHIFTNKYLRKNNGQPTESFLS